MASFSDKVKVLIDVDSTGATSGITKFRDSFKEAEGAVGKFKVVGGAAFDAIKANAAEMAVAAGAAVAGFVFKAVGEFQDLALSVDKFRDATGLGLDAASRWTEVAGDIGVSADVIEGAINRMNREAAKGEDKFNKFGIELAKHKDGTYNPEETFLRVIDRLREIEDPAERARVATELLGKGWTNLADLISKGSSDLKARLDEVSKSKVIDEGEVKKAERYRDAMDNLSDAFGDFMLEVGESFIPILASAMEALAKALGPIGDVVKAIGPQEGLTKTLIDMGATWDSVVRELGFEKVMSDMGLSAEQLASLIQDKALVPAIYEMRDAWVEGYRSMIDAQTASDDLTESLSDMDSDLNGLIDTWDAFLGRLDSDEAWDNLEEKIQDYDEAAKKAFAENTPAAWKAADDARRDAQRGIGEYIAKIGTIPPKMQTEILALVEEGSFAEAMRRLDVLARSRTVGLVPILPGDTPSEVRGRRALGGPVSANVPYLVGERGPEVFIPSGSGRISPGMGGTVVVNVAGSVVTENQLVESIRKGLIDAQRNGKQLVFTGP